MNAVREAMTRLSDALWVANHAVTGNDERLLCNGGCPGLQGGADGQTQDAWSSDPLGSVIFAWSSTGHTRGSTYSRPSVQTECPTCYDRSTRLLRPCGHVICPILLLRVDESCL